MGVPIQTQLEPDGGGREQDVKSLLGAESEGAFKELLLGLTPEIEKALMAVVTDFEAESLPSWRLYWRDFLEAEAFWKDVHYGFYNHQTDTWDTPSQKDITEKIGEGGQRFSYTTNFYRAWGWTLISVLGQRLPATRFLPVDYQDERDIRTARCGSDVAPLIERNNRMPLLNLRAPYLLYTHGIVASYTRYLVNGDRFGYTEEPIIEMQDIDIAPAGYECPCGNSFESTTEPDEDTAVPCPQCGEVLTGANFFPGEKTQAPVETGTKRVPKGQELITLHGGLELRVPLWTDVVEDWPFAGKVNEFHIAQVKHTYGKRAANVQGGMRGMENLDRTARLSLTEQPVGMTTPKNENLITIKMYWLRPSSYSMLSDEHKKVLEEIAPDGIKVVFTDTAEHLLDAAPEKIDDHWEYCSAHEGAGTFKPSLGHSAISINKRSNVLYNFIMEWVEHAAAGSGTFVNTGLLSIGALSGQRRAPGKMYPVRLPPNVPLSNVIHESRPGQIAGEVFSHLSDQIQAGQALTGAVPTVSGGTEQSLKPTTYLADREQAMGRLYGPWTHLQIFWANTTAKGVREFARYRTDDEKYSLAGSRVDDFDGRTINVDDLDGEFQAYPEASEKFPVLWHQMQAMYLKLTDSQDELIQSVIGHGRNRAFGKAMLGLPELYDPSEDQRIKQRLETKQLLTQQPIIQQVMPPIDPLSVQAGQLPQPQTIILPSIPIDEFEDDHLEHMNEVREWAVSPAGMHQRLVNPLGYQNVISHGQMHEERVKMQMLAAAPAPELPPGKEKTPQEATKDSGKEVA